MTVSPIVNSPFSSVFGLHHLLREISTSLTAGSSSMISNSYSWFVSVLFGDGWVTSSNFIRAFSQKNMCAAFGN